MSLDSWPLNVAGLEEQAAGELDSLAYDYYRSGAGDEITVERNRSAYARIELLPHVLRDVSDVRVETTLLGDPTKPILVAPTAFHGLACERAEVATAEGAAGAGAIFCLSSLSNTPLEAFAGNEGRRWFQLYVFRDRELTRELLDRAEAAGFEAIVLTVDAPVLGRRERDVRNGFDLPPHLTVACVGDRLPAEAGESGLAAYFASQLDPSLDWSDLEWLVGHSALPILVKGIHRPDDARRALDAGAAGVIVSNHGGRQLDTVPATIDMLPAVVDAVAGEADVLLDGGIRRGTDALKAIALGANAVLLGRPVLWALALDEAPGVRRVLRMLEEELRAAMALCGAAQISDLGPELIA
jgi:4-hydroxymandelate oxidase